MSKTRYYKSARLHELSVLIKGLQLEGILLGKKFKRAETSKDKIELWLRRRHFAKQQRSALLAFALLRGKQYDELEATSKQNPDVHRIADFVKRYLEYGESQFCVSTTQPTKLEYYKLVELWMNKKPERVQKICQEMIDDDIKLRHEKTTPSFWDEVVGFFSAKKRKNSARSWVDKICGISTIDRLRLIDRSRGLSPVANIIDTALFNYDHDVYADLFAKKAAKYLHTK